jgi:hypothetical protein
MYIFLRTFEARDQLSSSGGLLAQIISEEKSWEARPTPFLIPSMMVRDSLWFHLGRLGRRRHRINELERKMGVRSDYNAEADILSLDFSAILVGINSLNANLAWSISSCKMTRRLLDFMDSVAAQYRLQAIANGVDEDEAIEMEVSLLDVHDYLRSLNTGIIDQIEYLMARLQALSQNVSCNASFTRRSCRNSILEGL